MAGLLCWLLLISLHMSQVCGCMHDSAHPACLCLYKTCALTCDNNEYDVDLDLRQDVFWL